MLTPAPLHRWDIPPKTATDIQRVLAEKVVTKGTPRNIQLVAGADMHPAKDPKRLRGVICVLSFPELELVETQTAEAAADFPYVPGLLSFREGPAILACFKKLEKRPDLFLFDGQGIAHPRRFGLASHMGLWLDIPSIGCAKSRLFGDCPAPGPKRGDHSPITGKKGETIGACLRTKTGVKPVYVSVGHRLGLAQAIEVVLTCTKGYRLPEPLRLAHLMAKCEKQKRE